MKKYIFLLSILITYSNNTFSQDYECVNDLKTTSSTFGIWNWQVDKFNDIYVKDDNGQTLYLNNPYPWSPFFETAANDNVFPLKNAPQLGDVLDFQVSDGWELVKKRFGSSDDPIDTPYFILYNKYKAILRVFMYTQPVEPSFNSSYIQLKFNKDSPNESALLSHATSRIWALDNFEKHLTMKAINHYDIGNGYYWLYADFPMAYDPCTCGNYSYLSIKPFLVKDVSVNLVLNGTSILTPVISSGNTVSNNSFRSTLNKLDKNSALSSGHKAYKSLDQFVTTASNVAGLLKVPATNPNAQEINTDKKVPFKFPAAMKSIPKIGAAIGIMEFLINGGETEAKPKPHGFEAKSNFTISGEFNEMAPFIGANLNLPGSNWIVTGDDESTNPVYNNILGIFNLLETPTIAIKTDIIETEFLEDIDIYYKLNSNIKYVINPASGLSTTPLDIKGAFFFEGCSDESMISDKLIIDHKGTNGTNVYRTPYMSLNCLTDYVIDFNYDPNTPTTLCIGPQIYFKILVTLPKTGSVSLDDAVFLQFTYNVKLIDVTTPLVHGFDDYKINERIENVTLTQDETIYVWETGIIGSNINTNGYDLTVIAGADITVEQGVELNPNITLRIEEPTFCSGVAPVQTKEQIKTFCGSSNYNPSKTPRLENLPTDKPKPQFNMLAYPNPFETSTTIEFTLIEEENITLKLFNALGVQVESIMEQETLSAGTYKRVTRSDLSSGIYFAILQTTNGTQTIKIIKQ
jgi:hypothetical protein